MFRLHKTSIIRPFVSERVERKLYCCNGTYNYRIYIFRILTAWWWLFCTAETCSSYWICYNKGCLILIIACSTGTNAISHLKLVFSVLKMFFQIKGTVKTGTKISSEISTPIYKTTRCHIMLYHVTNSYDAKCHSAYSCNTASSIEHLTQTCGKFSGLKFL